MSEKPLERLNYYNGQRLTASELKLEQEYHIRVRRWLNKSLYSPGIARGLEVRAEANSPRVVVSPGLALDAEGREIILWDETRLNVTRKHHSKSGGSEAEVEGPYLVIRYNEELTAEEHESCSLQADGYRQSAARPASGGPSRVRSKPVFDWRDFLPHESSGEIVLAQVELDDKCKKVSQINAGVRRYVGAGSAAKVRQYALEGERELAFLPKGLFPTPKPAEPPNADVTIVGRIYFHIRGRQPNSVVLYVRALDMNPLYYTELGRHDHTGPLSGDVGSTKLDTRHAHNAKDESGELVTKIEKDEIFSDGVTDFPAHTHYLFGTVGNTGAGTIGDSRGFGTVNTDGTPQVIGNNVGPDDVGILEIRWGRHRHDVDGTTARAGYHDTHTHSLNGISAAISATGVDLPARARSGPSLTFVYDLQISIGPTGKTVNRTPDIRRQLAAARPDVWSDNAGNAKTLGDGNGNHELVMNGTGPIRLDFLPGASFTEDEYCIELSVRARANNQPNGGRILYNLYIE